MALALEETLFIHYKIVQVWLIRVINTNFKYIRLDITTQRNRFSILSQAKTNYKNIMQFFLRLDIDTIF